MTKHFLLVYELLFGAAFAALSFALSFYQELVVRKYLPEEYESSGTKKAVTKIIQTLTGFAIGFISFRMGFFNSMTISFTGTVRRIFCFYTISGFVSIILISIFVVDLHHSLIFDRFQIALLVLTTASIAVWNLNIWENIIGAVAGAAIFGAVAFFGYKKYGKDAMGFGDLKLVSIMGLFLGWKKLLVAILIASLAGSIILLVLQKKNNGKADKEYPFAPFLASGFIAAIYFGEQIINAYLNLLLG